MVHALEEQKTFTIKDKSVCGSIAAKAALPPHSHRAFSRRCALASLLTVALHSKLLYLTEVMEALLKDLMQQNSGAQPKLLLRRTEFTVEKLLTNWMSICLYGFLRVSSSLPSSPHQRIIGQVGLIWFLIGRCDIKEVLVPV